MRLTQIGYKRRLKRFFRSKTGVVGVVGWQRRPTAGHGKECRFEIEQQLVRKEVVPGIALIRSPAALGPGACRRATG
jgi:hypothetical protein